MPQAARGTMLGLGGLRPGRGDLPYLLLFLAAAAAGLYARFHGAGTWPVSYDEYFMGKSVRSILATGVPGMAGGGYYARGILVQYLMALSRATGLGEELSLRLVTILFNVAAVPALLLLGRKLGGYRAACLAGAAFCLSAWEIEFSRFARMYAPFQCLFLWFAWFLHGLVVEKRESCRAWVHALAFASIFVHEGSVFLIALSFLPPLLDRGRIRARHLALPAVSLAVAFAFNAYDFRGTRAAAKAGAAGAVQAGAGKLLLPLVMARQALASPAWAIPCAVLLAFCGYAVYRAMRDVRLSASARWTVSAAVVLGFLNCFGAAVCLAGAAALAGWTRREDARWDALKIPGAALLAAFIFWLLFFLAGPAVRMNAGQAGVFWPVARHLFGWPELAPRVFYMWGGAMPLFLAMTALLVPAALVAARDGGKERAGGTRLVALVVLVVLCLAAVLRTPYLSSRYVFPVFPFLLLLDACALAGIARRIGGDGWKGHAALLVAFAAFLVLSEDVRAAHLFRADSREANFRLGYRWQDVHHFVPRFDYRSPARFVDERRAEGDLVVSSVLQVDFYLRRPMDYFFIDSRGREFRNHFVRGGARERWTGSGLLADEKTFEDLVRNGGRTVWLIASSASNTFGAEFDRIAASRYGAWRRYTSVDGQVDVYRIPPQPPRESGNLRETAGRSEGFIMRLPNPSEER